MIIEEGRENQVWIAGGIGITPFISYIREHPILDKQIHFYYSFRGEENAVYLDLLRDYAQKKSYFELHLVDSTKDGYLNFEQKEVPEHVSVYMCGPLSMMNSLAKQIKKQNPKNRAYLRRIQVQITNYILLEFPRSFFYANTQKHCQISLAVF